MTMTSNNLLFDFSAPLNFCLLVISGKQRKSIDLTWVDDDEFIRHFNLLPHPKHDQGLRWLEAEVTLESLLQFHGRDVQEAADRFPRTGRLHYLA